jgi:hypothetical protein
LESTLKSDLRKLEVTFKWWTTLVALVAVGIVVAVVKQLLR